MNEIGDTSGICQITYLDPNFNKTLSGLSFFTDEAGLKGVLINFYDESALNIGITYNINKQIMVKNSIDILTGF